MCKDFGPVFDSPVTVVSIASARKPRSKPGSSCSVSTVSTDIGEDDCYNDSLSEGCKSSDEESGVSDNNDDDFCGLQVERNATSPPAVGTGILYKGASEIVSWP